MRYTKDEVRKKYMQIYQLKVVQRLSNEQISAIIPNCKSRTIQNAMKYVDEETYTNSSLIQMTVDGYNNDISLLYGIKETLTADFYKISEEDKYKITKRNSLARNINEITANIAEIRMKIAKLQGLLEKNIYDKDKPSYGDVTIEIQEVTMVKNADGTIRTLPSVDIYKQIAESKIGQVQEKS